jgi:6-pyruvoyltetrahydropterin/6-carboxytetrahydropterin synthase
MLKLTKIFHFEMAHAIHGYAGACRHVHGHSYELHVTVYSGDVHRGYIAAPGFVTDFKEIKKLVKATVIEKLDHMLLLSKAFLTENPFYSNQQNLVTWDAEPTAENMLLFIQKTLSERLSPASKLACLKLYETKDSYAEWINDNTFNTK